MKKIKSVRDLRSILLMTQKQLASKIGVTQAVISLWENNSNYPNRGNTKKLKHLAKLKKLEFYCE